MKARTLVGLDIGTASIRVAVIEERRGRPVLRALFKESAAGLKKGAIIDLSEASPAVARALMEAKRISKSCIKTIYANIGTVQMKTQHSRGIVAVSRADSEIYQDDIDRAIRASQAITLPPNRIIIHNVTREYIVDGVGDIIDPLGLSGNRLEVQSLVIDAFSPHVKHLMRAVELAGGEIGGLVLTPLAGARAALSKAQKDLGAVLIDIGFGVTSMCVYEEHKLMGVAVFPVGAGNITNDIAIGLKIPVDAAEAIKLEYGYALSREVNPKESIEISKFFPEGRGSVSRRFVAEIIESRLAEIFEFVDNELKAQGKAGELAGGAILTGGGAKLPGIAELAKEELRLSTRVGTAIREEWSDEALNFSESFEDPEFVNVLGLALWGAEKEGWESDARANFSMKGVLKYFLP